MNRKRKTADVVFHGVEAGLRMFRWVVVILLVLFLFSGVQKIEPDSVGLLLRFGKLQGATAADQVKQPGLVLALPFPIDQVKKVAGREKEGEITIDEVWKEYTGEATTNVIDPILEGYCLTGDQNIIQARLVVKYNVTDPIAFELWTDDKDREAILRDTVLAALVQTVAGWDVDDVLRLQRPDPRTGGATEEMLAQTVWQRAQERLDALASHGSRRGCGMTISALEFKEKHPPRHVAADFERVQSAKIAKDTLLQQANGYKNRELPAAEAERNRMVQAAKADKDTLLAKATAEVSEYTKLYEEYQKSPELVWNRIYWETMEQVFEKANKRFVPPGSRVIIREKDKDKNDGKEQP
jgi:membrane protease subunit HflK